MLTIALSKGRLAKDADKLFKKAGIETCIDFESRKLIFEDKTGNYKFLLVKPSDVCTYVELGAADIGVVGEDTILEEDKDLYKVLNLGFGKCALAIAGKADTEFKPYMNVATKYPHVAKKYFKSVGISANMIKLNGSVELAPIAGLSDVIVDIVETGSTLKENGLVVLREIKNCSAQLIVNKGSYKIKRDNILEVINKLKEQVLL